VEHLATASGLNPCHSSFQVGSGTSANRDFRTLSRQFFGNGAAKSLACCRNDCDATA
jgi:hypothetical protein